MNALVREFYRTNFHQVVFLTETKEDWHAAKKRWDLLPRGWFELSQLDFTDRIAFTRDFWLTRIPYHPRFHPFLEEFFNQLDDVGVVAGQMKEEGPWTLELVYSMGGNKSFFRGSLPCNEEAIDELKRSIHANLPHDYLAFLRMHNGFGKLSELGLLDTEEVVSTRRRLIDQLLRYEQPLLMDVHPVDPGSLIPFFEFFGLSSYQCFFTDWYPGNEMGNVYLSGIDYTISDYTDRREWADNLAFSTFLEWLVFYLEGNYAQTT
jgi:hypothetical protein